MAFPLIKRLLGISNHEAARAARLAAINALEPTFAAMSDEHLKGAADILKDRLADGQTIDSILNEAFALVRETSRRVLGQRHHDVQIIGGIILNEGKIAEMKTGEGKTLVAALATFLNALEGKGVHVVTTNDYLAARDGEKIGQIHRFLGLTVGVIQSHMDDAARQAAYACDVTYVTNSQLGFDYLRDNMRFSAGQTVQRGQHYAIVDEVDSILIDEARTPLIISGPVPESTELYIAIDDIIGRLKPETDIKLDEKEKTVVLTEAGAEQVDVMLHQAGIVELSEETLYRSENADIVDHVNKALKAHFLFKRDRHYMVTNGSVVIVDEFTGRTLDGRRFSDGIHQAIEAKERVEIQPENATLSSITYQNLFRLYKKLSGMTGTASTEADEFFEIYGLDVVAVKTNKPVARIDADDEIHLSADAKYRAIVRIVTEAHERGQPVLIGTSSVEKSETIASVLTMAGFTRLDEEATQTTEGGGKGEKGTFNVLNARSHAREASIIAGAGLPGAISIATNMAGRGTDIQLGGNADERIAYELAEVAEGEEWDLAAQRIRSEVEAAREAAKAAGGLLVIGTERHESRRIDNQLRGRSGRQGDPGRSQFFVSLDDDISRVFSPDRMKRLLPSLGLTDGDAISHPWISKMLEKAQAKVESANYDIRKNLIKYDDVNNQQRKAIYDFRNEIMAAHDVSEMVDSMRENVVARVLDHHIPANSYPEQWDISGLHDAIISGFELDLPVGDWAAEEGVGREEVEDRVLKAIRDRHAGIEAIAGAEATRYLEKTILLAAVDMHWQRNLASLERLRSVVGFRSVAQRDPVVEYRTDALTMFANMMEEIDRSVVTATSTVSFVPNEPPAEATNPS
jgi:preprotein translocase subunit SecA